MIFGSYKAFDGFMRHVEALKFQVMLTTLVRDMCSSGHFIFLENDNRLHMRLREIEMRAPAERTKAVGSPHTACNDAPHPKTTSIDTQRSGRQARSTTSTTPKTQHKTSQQRREGEQDKTLNQIYTDQRTCTRTLPHREDGQSGEQNHKTKPDPDPGEASRRKRRAQTSYIRV